MYGASTAIGCYWYAIFLVDVKTHNLFKYPLRDLTCISLKHDISMFTKDIGGKPRLMLDNRNFRLVGGKIATFLEACDLDDVATVQTHVTGISADHRNQNGLSEIRWKNILNIV